MIRTCVLAVLVLFGLCDAGFAAPNARNRIVLERFTSAQGHAYQLAFADCEQDECEIEIRLVAGERVLQRHATGWLVDRRQAVRDDFTAAGLVLEPGGTHVTAWRFGQDSESALIGARAIRIAPGLDGLLLIRMTGAQPAKRDFMIVGLEGGALRRLWLGGDRAAGPWVSWVERHPMPARGDRLLFFRVLVHPARSQLDTVVWRQLVWSAPLRRYVEEPARGLRTVVVGVYPNAAAARVARDRAARAGNHLFVASAREQRRPDGTVVLAAVTSIEPRAQQMLDEARRSGFDRATLARAERNRR
jgi:hypothetical protein